MTAHPKISGVLSVALDDTTTAKLDDLAQRTGRSRLALAEKAVADYVERESKIVAGIERGLDDMAAGRITPHDEAMRQIRTTIAGAHKA